MKLRGLFFHRPVGAIWLLPALALMVPVVADPAFAEFKTACDASVRCVAELTANEPASHGLRFSRAAGKDRQWEVSFQPKSIEIDPVRPINMAVDDHPPMTLRPGFGYAPFGVSSGYYLIAGPPADKLLARMIAGNLLRVEVIDLVGAPHDLDFPLSGLMAALAWIDNAQNRIEAPRKVATPEERRIDPTASRPAAIAKIGVPDRVRNVHMQISACEDPNSNLLKEFEPVTGILSSTALLYGLPCFTDGRSTAYRFYVVETGEIGGIRPQFFALFSASHGWMGNETLTNAEFDPQAKRLTSRHIADSKGNCGYTASWIWRGNEFALERYAYQKRCDGSRNPATWPEIYP